MDTNLAYQGYATRDRTATLFGQTMGLVAMTAGFFALGAYAGRHLSEGAVIVAWLAAFAVLLIMNFAARRSAAAAVVLLAVFGVLMGVASAPTLVWYASTNPQILWQAGGATALFIAIFGAVGYLTRRDLAFVYRIAFFALIALLIFGIVLIFVRIPHGSLIYAIIGLVVFAGLTMGDFQRLRRARGIESAPLLAASIFLDVLNVFFFFLRIFSGSRDLTSALCRSCTLPRVAPEGEISVDDPRAPDVRALLERHLTFALSTTPPEHSFALDVDGLLDPAITFCSFRADGELLGVGAIKELDPGHAEIKSMHTTAVARGRGVGRAMLTHLLGIARSRGYRKVSLETGTMDEFAPARALYESAGFTACGPFADYRPSEDNYFMTLRLDVPAS
ncbi:MAG TPA: GNAT family N-acetyltransferase [Trebonia sp.]|jgi:modulator of FtsH protease